MLNHSNDELPAISIIFTSRDLHFYLHYGIKGPVASVKHKINLVWPKVTELHCLKKSAFLNNNFG